MEISFCSWLMLDAGPCASCYPCTAAENIQPCLLPGNLWKWFKMLKGYITHTCTWPFVWVLVNLLLKFILQFLENWWNLVSGLWRVLRCVQSQVQLPQTTEGGDTVRREKMNVLTPHNQRSRRDRRVKSPKHDFFKILFSFSADYSVMWVIALDCRLLDLSGWDQVGRCRSWGDFCSSSDCVWPRQTYRFTEDSVSEGCMCSSWEQPLSVGAISVEREATWAESRWGHVFFCLSLIEVIWVSSPFYTHQHVQF